MTRFAGLTGGGRRIWTEFQNFGNFLGLESSAGVSPIRRLYEPEAPPASGSRSMSGGTPDLHEVGKVTTRLGANGAERSDFQNAEINSVNSVNSVKTPKPVRFGADLKLINLKLKTSSERGFVLVAVLLIVALATLAVVTTSMVAKVERTAAENGLAIERARANALFALDVALDQLQIAAGPDQRVSARADILQTGIDTMTQPYWTGVWKSYNPANPGDYELDLGNNLRQWSYETEGPTWLVSQRDPAAPVFAGNFTGNLTGDDPAAVKMATLPVIGNATTDVLVPRVPLKKTAGGNQTIGAYAYWIQDEGIKAKVNLVPNDASEDPENPVRYLAPATTAAELALEGNWRTAMKTLLGGNATSNLSKIKNPAMLDFVLGGNFSEAGNGLATSSPDITTHSYGVLSDTRKGGLKTDLTAAFEDTAQFDEFIQRPPPGRDEITGNNDDLYSDDSLKARLWRINANADFQSTKTTGPRFYSLKNYHNFCSQNNSLETPVVSKIMSQGTIPNTRFIPFPLGLFCSVYFKTYELRDGSGNPITNAGGKQRCGVKLYFHYEIIYYNPWNFSLELAPALARIDLNAVTMTLTSNTTYVSENGSTSLVSETGYFQMGNPVIYLLQSSEQGVILNPGESVVFASDKDNSTTDNGFKIWLSGNYSTNEQVEYDYSKFYPNSFQNLTPDSEISIKVKTRSIYTGNSMKFGYDNKAFYGGYIQINPQGQEWEDVFEEDQTFVCSDFFDVEPQHLVSFSMRLKGMNPDDGRWPIIPVLGYNGGLFNPLSHQKNSVFWDVKNYVGAVTGDELNKVEFNKTEGNYALTYWGDCDAGMVGREENEKPAKIILKEAFDDKLTSIAQLKNADWYTLIRTTESNNWVTHDSLYPVGPSETNAEIFYEGDGSRESLYLLNEKSIAVDDVFLNNEALFDRFFFSTIDRSITSDDVAGGSGLLNPRLRFYGPDGESPDETALLGMDSAAANLLVDGAFNVNSTSVSAWKSVLGSLRFSSSSNYPFPRIVSEILQHPPGEEELPEKGIRKLTEEQLGDFAEAMVEEVKNRGPFLSMADFVNRRLEESPLGEVGALQAAINRSGINEDYYEDVGGVEIKDPIILNSKFHTANKALGLPRYTSASAPGIVTQADILQALSPILSSRSDTFAIRVYGEAGVDPLGGEYQSVGKAYGEAIVQRVPEFIDQTDSSDEQIKNVTYLNQVAGRKFVIINFRWLTKDEI